MTGVRKISSCRERPERLVRVPGVSRRVPANNFTTTLPPGPSPLCRPLPGSLVPFAAVRHCSEPKLETTATRLRLRNSREDDPSSVEFAEPQATGRLIIVAAADRYRSDELSSTLTTVKTLLHHIYIYDVVTYGVHLKSPGRPSIRPRNKISRCCNRRASRCAGDPSENLMSQTAD